MRPTTALDENVFDINALLHPGTIFEHPKDVLAHPELSISENAPSLRRGHPTHRRSVPVPRCGRLRASRNPSPSTRSLRRSANWTADRATRRAASQAACVRRLGWRPNKGDATWM
jgi:hypothetical protein